MSSLRLFVADEWEQYDTHNQGGLSNVVGQEERQSLRVYLGIYNFQVCCGGSGWPTPYEVGIYLDADNRQCCIIDWPRPCLPVRFKCEYGDFLVQLDTATDDEILAAKEVAAEFFRDD